MVIIIITIIIIITAKYANASTSVLCLIYKQTEAWSETQER